MEYGYIVLASTKDEWFPALIRWVTKSKFSHSLITIPDILGIPMCMEASGQGVNTLRFDKGYLNNTQQEIKIYKVNVSKELKDSAIQKCLNDLEVSYGYLELPWFLWRSLNKFFGKDIKKQDNWFQNGIICSELCVSYLTYCGLGNLFKDFGNSSVNAQDLYEIIQSNPSLFESVL